MLMVMVYAGYPYTNRYGESETYGTNPRQLYS